MPRSKIRSECGRRGDSPRSVFDSPRLFIAGVRSFVGDAAPLFWKTRTIRKNCPMPFIDTMKSAAYNKPKYSERLGLGRSLTISMPSYGKRNICSHQDEYASEPLQPD